MGGMLLIVVVVLILAAVVAAVVVLANPKLRALIFARRSEPELPYVSRETLLTKGEAAFYHALRRALGDRYGISMKVRLCDVLTCSQEAWRQGYGNRIQSKHLDFVLTDHDSTQILAAIELDDRSHGRKRRKERDEFLDAAMSAARIPLIRVPAARRYDSPDLVARVVAAIEAGRSSTLPAESTRAILGSGSSRSTNP